MGLLPRPCAGCGVIIRNASRCINCRRVAERNRPRRVDRGYDYQWAKLSRAMREAHPYCKQCGTTKDLTVDHIIPLADGGPRLEPSNLQVLCRRCNSRKGLE